MDKIQKKLNALTKKLFTGNLNVPVSVPSLKNKNKGVTILGNDDEAYNLEAPSLSIKLILNNKGKSKLIKNNGIVAMKRHFFSTEQAKLMSKNQNSYLMSIVPVIINAIKQFKINAGVTKNDFDLNYEIIFSSLYGFFRNSYNGNGYEVRFLLVKNDRNPSKHK